MVDWAHDNLISKKERFLTQSVLKSLRESIRALKSCERVMPLAKGLGITQRCIDLISSRAPYADLAIFGWPLRDGAETCGTSNLVLWNGIDSVVQRKGVGRGTNADSWIQDLIQLSLPLFKLLILAMKEMDLNPEIIEICLMYYAKKYIPGISTMKEMDLNPEIIESCLMYYANKYSPGISRSSRKPSSSSMASENEQRELLRSIIYNLPLEKSSGFATTMRFLFGLLRTANILNASESCRTALQKKIGSQLEQDTLDNLLIPSYCI